MADELQIQQYLNFSKNGASIVKQLSLNYTVAGEDYANNTQDISTSDTILDLGNITTPGFAWIKNLDDTNFVEVGMMIGGPAYHYFIKLGPGKAMLAPLNVASNAVALKADTATVTVEFAVVEA